MADSAPRPPAPVPPKLVFVVKNLLFYTAKPENPSFSPKPKNGYTNFCCCDEYAMDDWAAEETTLAPTSLRDPSYNHQAKKNKQQKTKKKHLSKSSSLCCSTSLFVF